MTPTRALFVSVCLLAACDSKPKEEPTSEAKPEDKAEAKPESEAKPEVAAAPTKKLKYRKGQVAPGGMTPEEVQEYAEAQGDPKKGVFSLDDAFAGDETLADPDKGTLTATVTTSMGAFECELFEDDVPLTVANFVGLARGTRPWYDKKSDAW